MTSTLHSSVWWMHALLAWSRYNEPCIYIPLYIYVCVQTSPVHTLCFTQGSNTVMGVAGREKEERCVTCVYACVTCTYNTVCYYMYMYTHVHVLCTCIDSVHSLVMYMYISYAKLLLHVSWFTCVCTYMYSCSDEEDVEEEEVVEDEDEEEDVVVEDEEEGEQDEEGEEKVWLERDDDDTAANIQQLKVCL